MFSGRHHLKMDQKGRMRLPSNFIQNSELSVSLVVTNSLFKGQKCLDVYSLKEWEKLSEKMAQLPSFDAHVQAFQRFYLSSAQVIQLDAQGRLLSPTGLREFAHLKSSVVVIGMGSKFEIWDEKIWNKIFGDIVTNYDEILMSVSKLSQQEKS